MPLDNIRVKPKSAELKIPSKLIVAFALAVGFLPASVPAAIQTWNDLSVNYPEKGLIEPNKISIGEFFTTIGGGLDNGIMQSFTMHLQSSWNVGLPCSHHNYIKETARNISKLSAGDTLANLYRIYASIAGSPGAIIAGAAKGTWDGVQEVWSSGRFMNTAKCQIIVTKNDI